MEMYVRNVAESDGYEQMRKDSNVDIYGDKSDYIPINPLSTLKNLQDEQGDDVVIYARIKGDASASPAEDIADYLQEQQKEEEQQQEEEQTDGFKIRVGGWRPPPSSSSA